jgi:hypothetical protein
MKTLTFIVVGAGVIAGVIYLRAGSRAGDLMERQKGIGSIAYGGHYKGVR